MSVNNLFSTGIYVYSLPVVVGGFAFCSSNIVAVYVETGEESGRNFVAVANFMGRDFNTIINSQVDEGFFNDCPITFRDITWAKQTLIERLKAIYHTRIQYPTLKKEIEQKEK